MGSVSTIDLHNQLKELLLQCYLQISS